MSYDYHGTYWTIVYEPPPPPAPHHAGAFLVQERRLRGWKPDLWLDNLHPVPETDPLTGRSHRWALHPTAHSCTRALQRRYGNVTVCWLYLDPRTSRPRRAWLATA